MFSLLHFFLNFINFYYTYTKKIFQYQILLISIATHSDEIGVSFSDLIDLESQLINVLQ